MNRRNLPTDPATPFGVRDAGERTATSPDSPSRRQFLCAAGALAGIAATGGLLPAMAQTPAVANARLHVRLGSASEAISPSLVGLSYETLQMLDPDFLSGSNAQLISLLRTLNPDGILRIGGNTSDYALWSEYHGELPAWMQTPRATGRQPYVITPALLSGLGDFLRASGWQLIFGLNLRANLPDMVAQFAEAVQQTAGEHLLAIQIGNEADNYPGVDGTRIDFDTFVERWRRNAAAVRERVSVPLAGPDTFASTDWVIRFADTAEGITALTRHYYRGGAPQLSSTIPQLLAGDPRFLGDVAKIESTASRRGLPLILSEVNSYWGGGKLGISNTFASALWGGDLVLACAEAGVQSLEFHGGPLRILETALGANPVASIPNGDRMDQLDAISGRYSPIAGDSGQGFYARPLYYGLLLAQQFGGAHFTRHTLDVRDVNLTAYTGIKNGTGMVALFNKDLERDVSVEIVLDTAAARARTWRLLAPTISDMHHTQFAGTQIDASGNWTPSSNETVAPDANGAFSVSVPRASAALVWLDN